MASYKYIIPVFLILSGCGTGSESTDDNRGLGYSYDEISQGGLAVRYDAPQNLRASDLENIFHQVEMCIGAVAPPPLVIYMDVVDHYCDGGYQPHACVFLNSGTIVIENSLSNRPWPFAHEAVHWITHWNGMLSVDQQMAHDSPLFLECASPLGISWPMIDQ